MSRRNKSKIKKIAKDVIPPLAAVVDPVAGVFAVIIISSLSNENDNTKINTGRPVELEKNFLKEKSFEIFGNDNLPEARRDLFIEMICDKCNGWKFEVKRFLLEYHYLDKYAQDIAKYIDRGDEKILLYAKRVLKIIVNECRKTTVYYETVESLLRDIYHISERNKLSKKKALYLDECLCRYRENLADITEKDDLYPYLPETNISFVSDESLINEYDRFIKYDYFDTYLNDVINPFFDKLMKSNSKNQIFYQKKKQEVEKLLGSFKDFNEIFEKLNEIQQDLIEKEKSKKKNHLPTFGNLDKHSLKNCFPISGYYGAGKTTLSYKLANNNLNAIHVFLSLNKNIDLETQLRDSLNLIFNTNETAKKVLNDNRDMQFVFVIDNLLRGFLSENGEIFKVFAFIEKYNTKKNIKWLLLIQTDYLNWFQEQVKSYKEIHNTPVIFPWNWSLDLQAFELYDIWLKLDQRYKHIKVMDQILLEKRGELPRWINEVRERSYYTPLFIRIALSYKYPDELFHKEDLSYPEFCRYYYNILNKRVDDVMILVDELSKICRNKKLIEIIIPKDLKYCESLVQYGNPESLVQYGLLESQDEKENNIDSPKQHIFSGVPDIVWFYRIAANEVENVGNIAREIDKIYNQAIDPDGERAEEKEKFIMNICSMMVLLMEGKINKDDDKERCINCIKDILSSRYSIAASYILKKSVSDIRNSIISWLIRKKDEGDADCLPEVSLLQICEDGIVKFDVLQELIKYIYKIRKTLASDEISLFFNILYYNMEYYGYQDCIKILKRVNVFEKSKQVDPQKVGFSFANITYQNCNNDKDLVKESKKAFLDLGSRKKERFPNRIVDYYIEYIFDYYIAKNGFEGFKYLIEQHYYRSSELSAGKQNINKAIGMSGSFFYRDIYPEFNCKWDPKEYRKEYENMIEEYSKSKDIWKRRLALYLIVHTGLKHIDYRIGFLSEHLRQIFLDLYSSDDMQEYIDGSVKLFYKSNIEMTKRYNRVP